MKEDYCSHTAYHQTQSIHNSIAIHNKNRCNHEAVTYSTSVNNADHHNSYGLYSIHDIEHNKPATATFDANLYTNNAKHGYCFRFLHRTETYANSSLYQVLPKWTTDSNPAHATNDYRNNVVANATTDGNSLTSKCLGHADDMGKQKRSNATTNGMLSNHVYDNQPKNLGSTSIPNGTTPTIRNQCSD